MEGGNCVLLEHMLWPEGPACSRGVAGARTQIRTAEACKSTLLLLVAEFSTGTTHSMQAYKVTCALLCTTFFV